MAYENDYKIRPFQLWNTANPNQNNAPTVGYESGIGNPNDYEYFVDPTSRTVKRRAKQGLAAFAGTAAPAAGDGGGSGFTPAPSSSGGFGTDGKAGGPSLASQNANLAMMSVGGKMSNVPGLIGLLGHGIQALGNYGADQNLGYIGDNLGLLDSPTLGGTALASDTQGNLYSYSSPETVQAQNVADFGILGFDTSLGGYTGQSNENTNAGTSGSPFGGGGWGDTSSGGGYDGSAIGGGYSDGSDGGYW
jgi:hypothetical protein